jgi:hypothetical protein
VAGTVVRGAVEVTSVAAGGGTVAAEAWLARVDVHCGELLSLSRNSWHNS